MYTLFFVQFKHLVFKNIQVTTLSNVCCSFVLVSCLSVRLLWCDADKSKIHSSTMVIANLAKVLQPQSAVSSIHQTSNQNRIHSYKAFCKLHAQSNLSHTQTSQKVQANLRFNVLPKVTSKCDGEAWISPPTPVGTLPKSQLPPNFKLTEKVRHDTTFTKEVIFLFLSCRQGAELARV